MKDVVVAHPPLVTIKRAAELLGYTAKAIEQKIDKGVWPEGKVWREAPDGRRHIDLEAYDRWARGTLQ